MILTAALHQQVHATDIIKGNNTTALNDGGSWVGGGVPGASDVATWNNTVSAANTSAMGSNLSFAGILVTGTLSGAIGISTTSFATGSVSANATTDAITYGNGTVTNGDAVVFSGTAPTGLFIGRPYYVINATGTTYQVSDSINGAAINFTSAGTSVTQNVQSVLTLGSNGIVVNGSRSLPLLSSVVALSSNQTWSASSGRTIDSNNNTANGGLLVLNNGNTLTVDGAGATQIASLVGTGGLTKNGNGTLALVNGIRFSYSGEVRLNSGTVLVGNSNPTGSTTLGTGNLYLGTDASDVAVSLGVGHNGATSSYDNNTIIEGNATITLGAGTSFRLGTLSTAEKTLAIAGNSSQSMAFGATTLTGNATFNVGNPTLILAAVGQSGGSKSLVKMGIGILTINGTSTFTGQTIVNSGTLIIGTVGAINSSSSVTVANGAMLTNSNTSTSMSAGLILNPGATLSGAGAFAPASMTLVANLTGGNASFSSINAGTSSLTKSGVMEFTLSNITDGSYVIFSGSALSGSFSSVTVGGTALADLGSGNFGGTAGGFDYAFTNSTNTLGITTVPEPTTWVLLGLGGVFLIFRVLKSRSASVSEASASRV